MLFVPCCLFKGALVVDRSCHRRSSLQLDRRYWLFRSVSLNSTCLFFGFTEGVCKQLGLRPGLHVRSRHKQLVSSPSCNLRMRRWAVLRLPESRVLRHFIYIRFWCIWGPGIRHSQHFQRYCSGHGRRGGKRIRWLCKLHIGWLLGTGVRKTQFRSVAVIGSWFPRNIDLP